MVFSDNWHAVITWKTFARPSCLSTQRTELAIMGKKDGGAAGTSSNVYIMDKDLAWIPARLVEQSGDKAKVSVPEYESQGAIQSDGGKAAKSWSEREIKLKSYPGKILPMQNVDKAGVLVEKEDMCDLPYLHEVSFRVRRSF